MFTNAIYIFRHNPCELLIDIRMAYLNVLDSIELLYSLDSNLNLVYVRNISRNVVITKDVLVYYVNKEYFYSGIGRRIHENNTRKKYVFYTHEVYMVTSIRNIYIYLSMPS